MNCHCPSKHNHLSRFCCALFSHLFTCISGCVLRRIRVNWSFFCELMTKLTTLILEKRLFTPDWVGLELVCTSCTDRRSYLLQYSCDRLQTRRKKQHPDRGLCGCLPGPSRPPCAPEQMNCISFWVRMCSQKGDICQWKTMKQIRNQCTNTYRLFHNYSSLVKNVCICSNTNPFSVRILPIADVVFTRIPAGNFLFCSFLNVQVHHTRFGRFDPLYLPFLSSLICFSEEVPTSRTQFLCNSRGKNAIVVHKFLVSRDLPKKGDSLTERKLEKITWLRPRLQNQKQKQDKSWSHRACKSTLWQTTFSVAHFAYLVNTRNGDLVSSVKNIWSCFPCCMLWIELNIALKWLSASKGISFVITMTFLFMWYIPLAQTERQTQVQFQNPSSLSRSSPFSLDISLSCCVRTIQLNFLGFVFHSLF